MAQSDAEWEGHGEPIGPDGLTQAQAATLQALKSDIVNTVRQVVDVVSKYAGGAGAGAPNSSSAGATGNEKGKSAGTDKGNKAKGDDTQDREEEPKGWC